MMKWGEISLKAEIDLKIDIDLKTEISSKTKVDASAVTVTALAKIILRRWTLLPYPLTQL